MAHFGLVASAEMGQMGNFEMSTRLMRSELRKLTCHYLMANRCRSPRMKTMPLASAGDA